MKNSNLQKNSINLLEGDLLKLFCYCIEAKGKRLLLPNKGMQNILEQFLKKSLL